MAQEVHLMGATYSDVPSVLLPDSNNTFHSFVDTSDATASANKIQSGYTAYVNGSKVTGTKTNPSGYYYIYESGTYNVTNYAYAYVDVNSGPGGIDVSSNFFIELTYDSEKKIYVPTLDDFFKVASAQNDGLTLVGYCEATEKFIPVQYVSEDDSGFSEYLYYEYLDQFNNYDGNYGSRLITVSYGYKNDELVTEYTEKYHYNTENATADVTDVTNEAVFFNANGYQVGERV